jgi:hypothetical protein
MKMKRVNNPIPIGISVMSSVIITFGLTPEDQEFVNDELNWLFHAIAHTLQIQQGEMAHSQPIPVAIPAEAKRYQDANNQLANSVDDFNLQIWDRQLDSGLKRIVTHLRNLNILLDREASQGAVGRSDVPLQNQIRHERVEIVKVLQEMAQLMNQAYGILVTSPDQLAELLE